MNRVTDEELRRHLTRRTSKRMSLDERNEIVAAVAAGRARPRFSLRPQVKMQIAPIAGAVVLMLVALPLLWTLTLGPGPSPTSSSLAANVPTGLSTPAPPSPQESDIVTIFNAQQLSAMIGDPAWTGHVVLASAQLVPDTQVPVSCAFGPCTARLVGVAGQNLVNVGTRDVATGGNQDPDGHWVQSLAIPTQAGVFAFAIDSDSVSYLGPAVLNQGVPLTVAQILTSDLSRASDDVYVVSGWLEYSAPSNLNCPAPEDEVEGNHHSDLSWYCGGSWLNQGEYRATTAWTMSGLHAQISAYQAYAALPIYDPNGAIPRAGTYMVRSAGCPPDTMGSCPVFRMVGRLDETSSQSTPSPSESRLPQSSLDVLTQDQLITLAQDPHAAGRVVMADAELAPVPGPTPGPCKPPDPCEGGQIGVDPGILVESGWRDAASEGTGIWAPSEGRWLVRLEPPDVSQVQLMALRILDPEHVEYLGTVRPSSTGSAWSVDDVLALPAPQAEDAFVVTGWLVRTQDAPCPGPGPNVSPNTDLAYYCGGSFITPTPNAIKETDNDLDPGGLHVQWSAYGDFASNPTDISVGLGPLAGTSDEASYLVGSGGMRLTTFGFQDVWRLIGRVEPPESVAATATP